MEHSPFESDIYVSVDESQMDFRLALHSDLCAFITDRLKLCFSPMSSSDSFELKELFERRGDNVHDERHELCVVQVVDALKYRIEYIAIEKLLPGEQSPAHTSFHHGSPS